MKYTNIEDVTKLIKHIMIDDDLKQKDIVNKSGWSKQTVSNLLNNRTENIGINTLNDLCNSLGYELHIELIKNREDLDTNGIAYRNDSTGD